MLARKIQNQRTPRCQRQADEERRLPTLALGQLTPHHGAGGHA